MAFGRTRGEICSFAARTVVRLVLPSAPQPIELLDVLIVTVPRAKFVSVFETRSLVLELSPACLIICETSARAYREWPHCPLTRLVLYGCLIQDTIYTFSADCLLHITNRRSWNAPSITSRTELWPKIGFGPRARRRTWVAWA